MKRILQSITKFFGFKTYTKKQKFVKKIRARNLRISRNVVWCDDYYNEDLDELLGLGVLWIQYTATDEEYNNFLDEDLSYHQQQNEFGTLDDSNYDTDEYVVEKEEMTNIQQAKYTNNAINQIQQSEEIQHENDMKEHIESESPDELFVSGGSSFYEISMKEFNIQDEIDNQTRFSESQMPSSYDSTSTSTGYSSTSDSYYDSPSSYYDSSSDSSYDSSSSSYDSSSDSSDY